MRLDSRFLPWSRCCLAVIAVITGLADAASAGAQGAPRSTISGIVFDSVSSKRMPGAMVQLVRATPPNDTRSARSDSTGRFQFGDVPDGIYVLGFFHPTLDSLGLQPRDVRVEVKDGQPQTVAIGVPSALTIARGLCGPTVDKDTTGVFLGTVRDAGDETPVGGATITAEWSVLTVRRGRGMRRETVNGTATSTESGWFAVCGLPTGFPLEARVTSARDSSGYFQIELGDSRLLRRDVFVGRAEVVALAPTDSASDDTLPRYQGRAKLHGRVTGSNGSAIGSAQVTVRGGVAAATTDEQGTYSLAGLPEGTYEMSVRAVGFVPEFRTVDLRAATDAVGNIAMTPIGVYLDTVKVTASRTYASRRIQEFERRKARGFGRFIEAKEIASRHALTITSIIRDTPGLQVRFDPRLHQDVVLARHGTHECIPELYLDGLRIPTGAMDLDTFVRPDDLRAVEVYANWMDVPFEFMGTRGGEQPCGAVALWRGTQPRTPEPEKPRKPDKKKPGG